MTLSASTLADGVYRICTKMDTDLVCDIAYLSKADVANLMLGTVNGGNNQVFKMVTYNTDYKRFHPVHSGKDIDGYGRVNLIGDENLVQNTWNGGANQYWSLKHYTDSNVDGEIVYGSNNSTICWDVIYAVAKNAQNIAMSTAHPGTGVNLGRNQLWDFVKDSMLDSKLAVPSNVGWTCLQSDGTMHSPYTIMGTNSSTGVTRYIGWYGSGSTYQIRYRWQGRYTGTDSWSDYSGWMSMADNSTNDDGWGNAWTYNQTANSADGILYSETPFSLTNDQTTYDRKRYQVEVRRTGTNSTYGLTHGSSYTKTLNVMYYPTLTLSHVKMTVAGMEIGYASDFLRGGNTIEVDSVYAGSTKLLKEAYTFKNMPYSGSVTIPWSYLSNTQAVGTSITVGLSITTMDNYTRTMGAQTASLQYDSNYAAASSLPTIADADGMEQTATFPGATADRSCVLMWKEGGKTRTRDCDEIENNVFRIIPPIKKAYQLKYAATNSSDSTIWFHTESFNALSSDSFWWNTNDGDIIEGFKAQDIVSMPRDRVRDYEANLAQGDENETVAFGVGSKSTISVDVVFPLENSEHPYAVYDNAMKLETCDYATFRSPEGDIYRVAVTEIAIKRSDKQNRLATISMIVCE